VSDRSRTLVRILLAAQFWVSDRGQMAVPAVGDPGVAGTLSTGTLSCWRRREARAGRPGVIDR
jgi:hypothetical protein